MTTKRIVCEKIRGAWKVDGTLHAACGINNPSMYVPTDAKIVFRSNWRSNWQGPETVIYETQVWG